MPNIKNFRDGKHFNQEPWKSHFKNLPTPSPVLVEVLVGMILGDAYIGMPKNGVSAYIKFDQGYQQKEFVEHLFDLFKEYCFTQEISQRTDTNPKSPRVGEIKSYSFRTALHPYFTKLHSLFYKSASNSGKTKYVNLPFLRTVLTPRLLAYWIMCDGSLAGNKKTLLIHTAGFTKDDNQGCSDLLNSFFGLSSKVISHKKNTGLLKYQVKIQLY